jgi:Domain of unknown function (DUF5710)
MQNLAKRHWGQQLNVKEAADIIIDWCVRARDKNVLRKKPPTLFYAYIVEDTPPLQYLNNISPIFKYSQKDIPYVDQTRDTLLRCLSVALKAHFFLFQNEKVAHEPYFYSIPSLTEPNKTIHGLVYKIDKEDKSIIVCEKDLSLLFENNKIVYEFHTVVIEDSFKWFSLKNWYKIKQESNIAESLEKPWINKKNMQLAQDAKSIEELKVVATPIDVPYEIKDFIKPLGIEWSKHNKTWYLPKGFDVDSVVEYIEHIRKSNPQLFNKEQNNPKK